jgi:hypothetical protein
MRRKDRRVVYDSGSRSVGLQAAILLKYNDFVKIIRRTEKIPNTSSNIALSRRSSVIKPLEQGQQRLHFMWGFGVEIQVPPIHRMAEP